MYKHGGKHKDEKKMMGGGEFNISTVVKHINLFKTWRELVRKWQVLITTMKVKAPKGYHWMKKKSYKLMKHKGKI